MKRLVIAIVPFAPYALLGIGAWMVYPPAGLLCVGALIWIETRFGGAK